MTNPQTAIITGASSGVGEATALALSGLGMRLALIARRRERLERLAARLEGERPLVLPADLRRPEGAAQAMRQALDSLGTVDALVLCHGANIPNRALDRLSPGDWDDLIAANLSSVFYCVHAVLPAMRARGGGLIIAISSNAALRPSSVSGAAYSAAKAGLNMLSGCINAEEARHGIRSCVICPGDIDTELLEQRPQPPSREQRAGMLRAEDIAGLVVAVIEQPERALVEEIVVRPSRSG